MRTGILLLSIFVMFFVQGCASKYVWKCSSGVCPSFNKTHVDCAGEIGGSPFIRGTALLTKSESLGYDEYIGCMEQNGYHRVPSSSSSNK